MKAQWALLIGLIFALLISFIAIINFESVSVNYIFGQIQIPLIMVIFISAFLGAVVSSMFSLVRIFNLNRKMKLLVHKNEELENQILTENPELADEDMNTTKSD